MSKFANVPVEDDTVIILSEACNLEDLEVLYQAWIWEGIKAESLIFLEDDLHGMENDSLEKLARQSPIIKPDSSVTFTRNSHGYAFVNFNFQELE